MKVNEVHSHIFIENLTVEATFPRVHRNLKDWRDKQHVVSHVCSAACRLQTCHFLGL